MNKALPILQRRLQQNKEEITYLQLAISELRYEKRVADATGQLEDEYAFHDQLQYYKKQLVKYVDEQKLFKSLVKSLKG